MPQHSNERGKAGMAVVISPDGIPLVRELSKSRPIYWKFPAGQCDGCESAVECAARELEEETGIRIPPGFLTPVAIVPRRNHDLHVFGVKLTQIPPLKMIGDEGERIKVFTISEIKTMVDFHPDHRPILDKVLEALSSEAA